MRKILTLILVLIFSFMMIGSGLAAETIKIGFNIPLTGEIPKVGESSKFAAEMLKAGPAPCRIILREHPWGRWPARSCADAPTAPCSGL